MKTTTKKKVYEVSLRVKATEKRLIKTVDKETPQNVLVLEDDPDKRIRVRIVQREEFEGLSPGQTVKLSISNPQTTLDVGKGK